MCPISYKIYVCSELISFTLTKYTFKRSNTYKKSLPFLSFPLKSVGKDPYNNVFLTY